MSSHMASPRERNLDQVLHIFSYLRKHQKSEMVFDQVILFLMKQSVNLKIGHQVILFMSKVKRTYLPEEPRGLGFLMRDEVDADHASVTVAGRSRNIFLVWLNCSLIHWL